MRIHSHYDNLKVSRDAPQSVIKAAYRTLSQQYHPDISKDPDAARIMGIINGSYTVLSNPIKRKEHDTWLDFHEKDHSTYSTPQQEPTQEAQTSSINGQQSLFQKLNSTFRTVPISIWLTLGFLGFIGGNYFVEQFNSSSTYTPSTSTYSAPLPHDVTTQKTIFQEEKYEKPLVAPNGEQWPHSAGYLKNYALGNTGGLSTISIDNTQQQHDLYVKLIAQDSNTAVRHVYIPKKSKFIIKDIAIGNYELRYKDLNTGRVHKAETIIRLIERPTYNGVEYGNIHMTLYQVPNGNMRTHQITEEQF